MNGVNKTLYIPLYGKAYVSKRGLFLRDEMAERIWSAEGFKLRGKSASKWLAFYMGIRAAVFDEWLRSQLAAVPKAVVLHIGCGLDSRVVRVGTKGHKWYDVDFPQVIGERKRYFSDDGDYRMISADVRDGRWLEQIAEGGAAIVVMEGVSMYLTPEQLRLLTRDLSGRFDRVRCLMDCYTELAGKLSRYQNPINDVGVTQVYGLDDPASMDADGFRFLREQEMTPARFMEELGGAEKVIFEKMYAGGFSKKLYRLYEFRKD